MISFSIATIVGLGLWAVVLMLQAWAKAHDENIKRITDEDSEIDSSNDADDLLRQLDKLRK